MSNIITYKIQQKGKFYISLIILFFIAFTIGCSRDKDDPGSLGGNTTVSIDVVGIKDSKSQSNKPSKIASLNNKAISEAGLTTDDVSVSTTYKYDIGFTVDAIAEQTSIGNGVSGYSGNLSLQDRIKKGLNNKFADQNMTAGRTYRIILYNKNTTTVFKVFDGVVGTPIKFDVSKGSSYDWFAYSYNDDQPLPALTDLQNPQVAAPIDKDLLYATGTLTIPTGTPTGNVKIYPVPITFEHKMTKVSLKVDASKLAMFAKINEIKAHFIDENNFKSATFNIRDNSFTNIQTVPVNQFLDLTSPTTDTWEYTYYTADASLLDELEIKFTELPVTFKNVDPTIASLDLATFTNANFPVAHDIKFVFKYTNPSPGDELIANVGLSYTLDARQLMHVSNNTEYAYAFQSGPSWKMISDRRNFGDLDNSLVRMRPWDPANPSKGVWKGGDYNGNAKSNWVLAYANPTNILNKLNTLKPDILIIGYDFHVSNQALTDAIVKFVDEGGVLIWFNEFRDIQSVELINKLCGTYDPSKTYTQQQIKFHVVGDGGEMYPTLNVDDRVLNGPFGDARNKLWGEDASLTHAVSGLPANNDFEIYSYGQAVNKNLTPNFDKYVTMFRHKRKNFFYLGDGGLISAQLPGAAEVATACPFVYDVATGYPKPKRYGEPWTNPTPSTDPRPNFPIFGGMAYNGVIAGNIMLWAAELIEFQDNRWRYAP